MQFPGCTGCFIRIWIGMSTQMLLCFTGAGAALLFPIGPVESWLFGVSFFLIFGVWLHCSNDDSTYCITHCFMSKSNCSRLGCTWICITQSNALLSAGGWARWSPELCISTYEKDALGLLMTCKSWAGNYTWKSKSLGLRVQSHGSC